MSTAKRQPDHHCPGCHRFSRCHLEQGMAACPVPRDVLCGSCALTLAAYLKKPPAERRRLLAGAKRIQKARLNKQGRK